jgi:SAM-dependent methyltransferase
MPLAQRSSEIFQFSADVYRKMVDENYLFHREVYAKLRARLSWKRPFRFLDVACWDATCSGEALAGSQVIEYHGIDIVPEALAIAAHGLRKVLACPIHLQEGDFVALLAHWDRPVDVVWIGLSLHHLGSDGKFEVMRNIRKVLSPGGELLIYENTSPDGENRAGWLARWDLQREKWTAYSDEEFSRMNEHVHTFDFPETHSNWLEIGLAAGFRGVDEIYASPTDLFRMYRFAS